jgi:hypothetical protein
MRMKLILLIEDIKYILEVMGSLHSQGDSPELEYQDKNLFLRYHPVIGRVWAAVPVWDEETQEVIWESVLDVPEADTPPAKFLLDVTPETLDITWVEYLDGLRSYAEELAARYELTAEGLQAGRSLRQFIGCPKLDLWGLINQLGVLKTASIPGIQEVLLLIDRMLLLTPDQWKVLLGGVAWNE